MGRGKKKKKPEQSDAKEPDKPPPVAPRPKGKGGKKADTSFEQESSSKGGGKKRGPGGKKVKKGDRQLSSRSQRERKGKGWLEVRLCCPLPAPRACTQLRGAASRHLALTARTAAPQVTWMTEGRKCTDCLFCLGMLGYWFLMGVIFLTGAREGNMAVLLMPVDTCVAILSPDPQTAAACPDMPRAPVRQRGAHLRYEQRGGA